MAQAGPSRLPTEKFAFTQETVKRLRPAIVDPKAVAADASTWQPSAYKGYYTRPLVESLCFDDAGEQCAVAGEDEAFTVWDAVHGVKKKTFYSRKYGLSHIRYMHHRNNILHASTRLPSSEPADPIKANAVRYHSTHDNKYLMYFHGHTARVRSISVHPTTDTFLSAGDDGTVRMFDLRHPNPKALMNDMGGSCLAAFDSGGQVFATACGEKQLVGLYAVNSPDGVAFLCRQVRDPELARRSTPPRQPIWTSISFSNNGDFILIGTSGDVHYVLDAFTLYLHARLEGHKGLEHDQAGQKTMQPRRGASGNEVSFTSDSNWVISGAHDGKIHAWNLSLHPRDPEAEKKPPTPAQTLHPVVSLLNSQTRGAPTTAVRMSNRYGVMAVGSDDLSFWLPSKGDATDE